MNEYLERPLVKEIVNKLSQNVFEEGYNALKPVSGQIGLDILINYFLGEDWYVVDPLTTIQVNAIAIDDIRYKYKSKAKAHKHDKRKIHYNLKPISGQKGLDELINYFLGEDWYIAIEVALANAIVIEDGLANAIAIDEIKKRYRSKVKKPRKNVINLTNCAVFVLVFIYVFIFLNVITSCLAN